MRYSLTTFILILITSNFSHAQFSDQKKDFQKFTGLFDFYYDDANDKMYMEVKDLEKEFLYVYSLSSGI